MKCPHCGELITKPVILCPFCYTHEEIECYCSGGGSYGCHRCGGKFQAYDDHYWYAKKEGGEKQRMQKIEYIDVDYEWEGWW